MTGLQATADGKTSFQTDFFSGLLEESVNSILQQESVNFEYIIIDDCSTDKTISLLESIKSPRLRLLRNSRNLGFTRSMRKAASEARGEYIAVHDAGDISFPQRLAKQVERLDADPEIVAIGSGVINYNTVTGDKKEISFCPILSERNPFTHGEVTYRKKAYELVGGYRELFYYSQDSDLWRRLGDEPDRVYRRGWSWSFCGDFSRELCVVEVPFCCCG